VKDDSKEAVVYLQQLSTTFVFGRIAAAKLVSLWNSLLERLDNTEIFSISFWFLEQLGKNPDKDLGLTQCFISLFLGNYSYVRTHNLITLTYYWLIDGEHC